MPVGVTGAELPPSSSEQEIRGIAKANVEAINNALKIFFINFSFFVCKIFFEYKTL